MKEIDSPQQTYDPLSMYHHQKAHLDRKIHELLLILEKPKEIDLNCRFKAIQEIIDNDFYYEMLHFIKIQREEASPSKPSHPSLLLHLHCFLEITDSISVIADYLNLTIEEVVELIKELHNTFHIASLMSEIYAYYKSNKYHREEYSKQKIKEYLGDDPTYEAKDLLDDHKKRLRRKYGKIESKLNEPDGII